MSHALTQTVLRRGSPLRELPRALQPSFVVFQRGEGLRARATAEER